MTSRWRTGVLVGVNLLVWLAVPMWLALRLQGPPAAALAPPGQAVQAAADLLPPVPPGDAHLQASAPFSRNRAALRPSLPMAAALAAPANPQAGQAPRFVGVLRGADGRLRALLEGGPAGDQKLVAAGAVLADWKVLAVGSKSVLLSRDNARLELRLGGQAQEAATRPDRRPPG
jgi:hypothetical protein